jgi:hypothetical protein
MDGGEAVTKETADVIKHHDDMPAPLPKEVTILRDIINDFKNAILDSLTPDNPKELPAEAQDMRLVDMAIAKLQSLSNILTAIISGAENFDYSKNMEDIDKLLEVFHERHFDIKNMDDETRSLCIHFINNDLVTAPFDRRHKINTV